jgi:transcriptional regulator with XRE-family HTH domain
MHLGVKLLTLRESCGWTQDQLADRAGVPVGSIRNYEQGRREPPWDALFRLAEALGVGGGAFFETFRPCVGQPVEEAQKRRPGRPRASPPAPGPPGPAKRRGVRGPDARRRGR